MALTDQLVAVWRLDEANASDNAAPAFGGITGTQINSPPVGAGTFSGNIRNLNSASSQAFDMGDPTALRLSTFTLSAWVFLSSAATTGFTRTVIAKSNAGLTIANYLFDLDDANRLRLYFTQGTSNFIGFTTTGTIAVNRWSHVVATFDGTLMKIYINGVLDGSGYDPSGTPTPDTTSGNFYLGRVGNETQRYWNGYMDEVAVWSRALSAAEVAEVYAQGTGLFYPYVVNADMSLGCVDYWKLDSSYASSGSGGNTLVPTGSPTFTTGRINSGVQRNGTAQTITVSRANYVLASTVAAWIKPSSAPAGNCPIILWRGSAPEFSNILGITSGGKGIIQVYDGVTDRVGTGNITIPTDGNTWTHLALVIGSSHVMRLYVNGVLDTLATTSLGAPFSSWSAGPTFYLTTVVGTGYVTQFNGVVDEVGIWNRMLAPSELTRLWNSGSGLSFPFASGYPLPWEPAWPEPTWPEPTWPEATWPLSR